MSTKAFDDALDFMPRQAAHGSVPATLRKIADSLTDGLRAWRHYERRVASGIPHAVAAREAAEVCDGRQA